MTGFPEGGVQLLDKDVTVPIVSDPNNSVAVLDLEKARSIRIELMVTELKDGCRLLGRHQGLSSVVDVPPPESCLEMKAPPECGGLE